VLARLARYLAGMEFNLGRVHDAIAEAAPEREALVFRDRRLTHGQLLERSRRFANFLLDRGLRVHRERASLKGHESGQDHLAIYLYNGNEYLEGMLGAYKARVAPLNVNYRYVDEELRYLLRDAGARALLYHAEFAPRVAAIRGQLPELELLVQVADGSGNALLPGARSTTRRRSRPRLRLAPRWSLRPTTSTSSTPAARPACRRACSGDRRTSSSRRWVAGSSTAPSGRLTTRSATP
jgi:acyl-CoA synthetase (AMP-forming)/AMP-acid ligase II